MEELKTKYLELDNHLARTWGEGADASHELREIKNDLEALNNDDLNEAIEVIEETLDKIEELDTYRDKIKEVLGIKEEDEWTQTKRRLIKSGVIRERK
mgnify:CR=1 FL=1